RIEVEMLGTPTVLRGEEWTRTIGQDFEPLAHHCVRGWTRSGLRVEVIDPEDPTTAWVASTRRPGGLALARRTAQTMRGPAGGWPRIGPLAQQDGAAPDRVRRRRAQACEVRPPRTPCR